MIIYPSIDVLLDRIPSKYSLCSIAAKRAHDLQRNQNPLLDHYESPKYVGQALEEIQARELVIDPEPLDLNKDADEDDNSPSSADNSQQTAAKSSE